jgi:hypothetical protein
MISLERFQLIRERHGHYASWAVWAVQGKKPKDSIADLNVFDPQMNPELLQTLFGGFVFLGLNISRRVERVFGNFHDVRPMATDYKIRAAIYGTRFWGSYMTDIIKDFEQKVSGKVMSYLKANPSFEQHNIALLRQELSDLGAEQPVLIAFGKDAEKIARRNLATEFEIVGIPHYAKYLSAEAYRTEVNEILAVLP